MKTLLGLSLLLWVSAAALAETNANVNGASASVQIAPAYHGGNWYNRPVGWAWGTGWRWASTLQGDILYGLGQLRLNTAQANYINAQAAQEWEKARLAHAQVQYYITQLKVCQFERAKLLALARRLDEATKNLNTVVMGKFTPFTYSAFYLLMTQPQVDPVALAGEKSGPLEPLANFTTNSNSLKQLKEFAGGNAMELIEFLRVNNYSVKVGSPAWTMTNQLRTALLEQGEKVLDDVVAHYQAMAEGRLE